MFHKATDLKFKEGTKLEVTFQDGKVNQYDMAVLFEKYPQLRALEDRELFRSGQLLGYGIRWSDDLDIEIETIYEEGQTIRIKKAARYIVIGKAVAAARAKKNLSQKELSELSGIDQSDISKIERGVANPSVATLTRIAEAMGAELQLSISI